MAIAAVMLLTCLPALAEQTRDGQITVIVGDEQSKFIRSGVQLAAYLLARGDYGDWTTVKNFETIKITSRDDGSAWIDQSMKQIHNRIKLLRLQPTAKATTNAQGTAVFKELEHGIYYVEAIKYTDPNLTVSAMLLSTPNREREIQITAIAKFVHTPPTEEEPPPTKYWPPVQKIIVPVKKREHLETIDEYETALGLGNIQIHVGVCFE